jgi:hypothetical protein
VRFGVYCWGCITLAFEEQHGEVITEVGTGHVSTQLVQQGVERLLGCACCELRDDVEEGGRNSPCRSRASLSPSV